VAQVLRAGGGRKSVRLQPPRRREAVYRAYWEFAAERHQVYEKRLLGEEGPWTEDDVLQRFRFCNAFRASDRVSQYLIKQVVYGLDGADERDRFLRTVLFRLFSRPSTWELLEETGEPVCATTFDQQRLGDLLDRAFAEGQRLYTSAFILCANSAYGHARKHRNHLALVTAMLDDELPQRICEMRTLGQVYSALTDYPLIGPFMAYQLAIDLNYGPDLSFSEDDFTMPGPGAARGLSKVFVDLGDYSPQDAIHWLVDQQATIADELGVAPPRLFDTRPLHAIDCQNVLCEVDKYARVRFPSLRTNRQRIKQTFTPAGPLPKPFFPPRWGLNRRAASFSVSQRGTARA
jgi:alpha-glutamyl/putrescinyl thymine pyrophosphorylase clade 1